LKSPPQDPILGSHRWLIILIPATLVLATYLWLCVYAYPATDDWFQASGGRDHGVWTSVASYWHGTGGRWFMALLVFSLGLFPDLSAAYPLLVLANIVALVGAGTLIVKCWGINGAKALILATMLLAALQFTCLPMLDVGNIGPHTATPETIYWLSGSWPYAGAYPLLAVAAWLILGSVPGWFRWCGCIVIGLLVSGLSEMAAVAGVMVGATLGGCGRRHGWVLAAASAVGFGISMASPGNLNRLAMLRQEVQSGAGISKLPAAMLNSLQFTAIHLVDWLTQPALIAAGLLVFSHSSRQPTSLTVRPRWCLFAGIGTIVGVWAMAIPTLALVGFLEARHEGLVGLFAVAGLLSTAALVGRAWPLLLSASVSVPLVAIWFSIAIATRLYWPSPISPLGRWSDILAAACLLILLIAWMRRDQRILVALSAVTLLWQPSWWQAIADATGKAPTLDRKVHARDHVVKALVDTGQTQIVIPWLGAQEIQPRTIRIYEVQPGWMADGYAAYFRISRLIISERVETPRPARLSPTAPAAEAPAAPMTIPAP